MKRQKVVLLSLMVLATIVLLPAVFAIAQPPAEKPAEAPPAEPAPAPAEAPPAAPAPPAPEPAAPALEPGKGALVTTFLWIDAILGLWLIISPFALKYEGAGAKYNTLLIGVIVLVLSVIAALG